MKSRFCQVTDAGALPATTGAVSGSVALNVMVAGLTLTLKLAAGCTDGTPPARSPLGGWGDTGRMTAGGPAATNHIEKDSQAPIGLLPTPR